MDEFYQNYKSAWRPLVRENETSAVGMPPDAAKLKKDAENTGKHANSSEVAKQTEILNKLAEISADIHALNDLVLEQSQKTDNLLSCLEEKEAAGKKPAFWQLKK
ncbi:hypothetical protein [Oscillibacter sp.]|uniref:hypothetical protein n=1 Tax=Oscillibacter sp. TaxID=1945593 RepID=UPI003395AE8F